MRCLRALPLVALLWAGTAARAGDLDTGGATFLDLGVFHTPFRYPDGDHQADVGRYGVAYSEPLSGDASIGLHGGYATLQVDGEPEPLSESFDGRYLGLSLRYEGTQGDHLNLFSEFSYTWHDVAGHGFLAPQSDITWYESWLAMGPVLRYYPMQLYLGAYYQYLQGTETDDQPARVLDFHSTRGLGAYFGLAIYMEPDYSICLMATAGARRGIRLLLRRDF